MANTDTTPKADLYQLVTDKIIAALEKGVAPWARPWATAPGASWRNRTLPYNGCTGKQYNGVNIMILWAEMASSDWTDPRFYSYRQAALRGGQVRKGEKGTTVVYFTMLTVKDNDPKAKAKAKAKGKKGKDATKRIPLLRAYTVFNRAQCDWQGEEFKHEDPTPAAPTFTKAAELVEASGASIRHGGDSACYVPSTDLIKMPKAKAFDDEGAYWATLLHELTHWTGAKGRCDRNLKGRFGDNAYAAEELIAEMGSAFLCAHLDVVGTLRHPEYLGHWLSVLKADKYAIFTASREAQKACEFLVPKAQANAEGEDESQSGPAEVAA